MAVDWTVERQEYITRRWQEGAAASEIAFECGPEFTKSGIIGKLNRMGAMKRLKGYHQPIKGAPRKPKHTFRQTPRQVPVNITRIKPPSLDLPPSTLELEAFNAAIPAEQRKTLFELTGKTCKYPVGDPGNVDFFFCGATIDEGPYCGFHSRACFNGFSSFRPKPVPAWK